MGRVDVVAGGKGVGMDEVRGLRGVGGVMSRRYAVADPRFPAGGNAPPMQALFGENVRENEKNWVPQGGGEAYVHQWYECHYGLA